MSKVMSMIRILLVGIGCIVLVAMYCIIQTQKAQVVYIFDTNIPSAFEIQQKLKDLNDPRYDPGKVDGVIGKKSITAWDNFTCDQFAKQALEAEKP